MSRMSSPRRPNRARRIPTKSEAAARRAGRVRRAAGPTCGRAPAVRLKGQAGPLGPAWHPQSMGASRAPSPGFAPGFAPGFTWRCGASGWRLARLTVPPPRGPLRGARGWPGPVQGAGVAAGPDGNSRARRGSEPPAGPYLRRRWRPRRARGEPRTTPRDAGATVPCGAATMRPGQRPPGSLSVFSRSEVGRAFGSASPVPCGTPRGALPAGLESSCRRGVGEGVLLSIPAQRLIPGRVSTSAPRPPRRRPARRRRRSGRGGSAAPGCGWRGRR